MYSLESVATNEKIEGKFYAAELLKISDKPIVERMPKMSR